MNYILEYDVDTGDIISYQPDCKQDLKEHEIYITEALWCELLATGSDYTVPVSTLDPKQVYDNISLFTKKPPITRESTMPQKDLLQYQLNELDRVLPRVMEDFWEASKFDTTLLPQITQDRLHLKQSLRAELQKLL